MTQVMGRGMVEMFTFLETPQLMVFHLGRRLTDYPHLITFRTGYPEEIVGSRLGLLEEFGRSFVSRLIIPKRLKTSSRIGNINVRPHEVHILVDDPSSWETIETYLISTLKRCIFDSVRSAFTGTDDPVRTFTKLLKGRRLPLIHRMRLFHSLVLRKKSLQDHILLCDVCWPVVVDLDFEFHPRREIKPLEAEG